MTKTREIICPNCSNKIQHQERGGMIMFDEINCDKCSKKIVLPLNGNPRLLIYFMFVYSIISFALAISIVFEEGRIDKISLAQGVGFGLVSSLILIRNFIVSRKFKNRKNSKLD